MPYGDSIWIEAIFFYFGLEADIWGTPGGTPGAQKWSKIFFAQILFYFDGTTLLDALIDKN